MLWGISLFQGLQPGMAPVNSSTQALHLLLKSCHVFQLCCSAVCCLLLPARSGQHCQQD